ncbi:MAG: phage gp6-like head-tail connector protein [Burkholderiales bacterium]|nr:phage gp6-like head-tail connector protein [Burkholderiales bacterium]MBK8667829.1 phage gp6-like head-tail connector protein [Burkholderiales bacterium]MBK8667883.1 phage gp6-like head-tail connector protein [Burkholderiales bacterium]
MLLDLATVKLHLRVDDSAEDALIGLYVTAAEESAMQFLGRTIYATELAQGLDTAGIVINPAIQAALLLIVGHLYANREDVLAGVSVAQLPNGSQYLLQPYRAGLGV